MTPNAIAPNAALAIRTALTDPRICHRPAFRARADHGHYLRIGCHLAMT
jgi:hypothetical protein